MCMFDECGRLDRRTMLGGAAAAALAAHVPAAAKPGVTVTSVTWDGGGVPVEGHLAFKRKDAPIVVVLHGNAGLPADVRGTADWLASHGFVGFAIHTTARYPDPTKIPRSVLAGRGYGNEVVADARAGLTHLARQGFKSDRLGIIGYCGGGYIGLLWADSGHGREIDAFVGIHASMRNHGANGIVTSRPQGIDLYRRLAAPAQFHFGGADPLTPPEDIADQRALAKQLGKSLETYVYDGAEHGFALFTDPNYRADHTKVVNQRTLQFLKRHLG